MNRITIYFYSNRAAQASYGVDPNAGMGTQLVTNLSGGQAKKIIEILQLDSDAALRKACEEYLDEVGKWSEKAATYSQNND